MSTAASPRPRSARLRRPLALALALAIVASAAPAAGIDNGSFEHGLAGWQVEPTEVAVGAANAEASAAILDGFLGTRHSVSLMVFAGADGASGASSSHTGVRLRHPGVVGGRFLDFQLAGGWGISHFGGAFLRQRAEVVVRGTGAAAGREARVIAAGDEFLPNPCSQGVFADYGILPVTRTLDLGPAGFARGNTVEIEISWQVMARADAPCDQAELIGQLVLDDLAFRG